MYRHPSNAIADYLDNAGCLPVISTNHQLNYAARFLAAHPPCHNIAGFIPFYLNFSRSGN